MSLFTKLFEAVHSWRRRRVGVKPSRKRSGPTMEQLDHRQLLAVNFTGVVANDFPVTNTTGVQVITGVPFFDQAGNPTNLPNANNAIPIIPGVLRDANLVTRSGYEIDQLRVTYTPIDDTLSIGVEGPNNGRDANQVIAGDADNNGNSGTVDPRISNPSDPNNPGVDPALADPPDMSGSESYGISLAFNNPTVPDVVAGFPQSAPTDTSAKPFVVARYQPVQPSNDGFFDLSQTLPQYTGNYYLANDPTRPNFELQIPRFSLLYQQITGKALTSDAQIGIGAFASSIQSGGISDELFSPLPLNLPIATPPPPPPPPTPTVCPPVSPPVYVNYHQDNHINTAHNGAIRVNVLGSSGFDPTTIVPSSVRFGDAASLATTGASPVLNFERNVNNDGFPDETFVFNGLDVKLPAGKTVATISGVTTSGQTFQSSVRVFNRDASYYTPAQINAQQARFERYDQRNNIDTSAGVVAPPTRVPTAAQQRETSAAIDDLFNPLAGARAPRQVNPGATTNYITTSGVTTTGVSAASTATVSIPKKNGAGKVAAKGATVRIKAAKAGAKATAKQASTPIDSMMSVLHDMPSPLNLAGGS